MLFMENNISAFRASDNRNYEGVSAGLAGERKDKIENSGKKGLSVLDLRFSYEKGKEILHGISSVFSRGKITALIGANGCGKSTLLNLIAGVLRPDRGAILLDGKDIKTLKRTIVARNIAVVHQSNTAPDDISVEKLVFAGRTPYKGLLKRSTDADELAVKKALLDTDTEKFSNRRLASLSGGQMQRVWLAMALAQETDILLLDEITTYLDIHYQLEILNLISKLNREKGMTVLMVLHDVNLAFEFCVEIIVMKDGKVTVQGDIDSVADEGVLNEAFDVSCKIISIDGKKHCVFNRKGGSDV